jgi:hypothetical protein
MALRLQLAPRALRTLTGCPASVRERLQYELGALAAGLPLEGPPGPERAELVVLASGFRVRYWLELHHGLLRLTHVLAPDPGLWPR